MFNPTNKSTEFKQVLQQVCKIQWACYVVPKACVMVRYAQSEFAAHYNFIN